MKKYLLFIGILTSLVSCATEADNLVKEAQQQAVLTMKEVAKNPESVKVENFTTAYSNDSLCILRFDFTGKNGLGIESTHKYEYVYLAEKGKKYETFSELDSDSIYISPEMMDKVKKGKIFESCTYDEAIKYLSVVALNSKGRVAGNSSEEFMLPVPTETGLWELKTYKDEFGDESNDTYLVLTGKGVFSNSATTNSEMSAILFVDDNSVSIRLVEYSSSVVKDQEVYTFKVKGEDGDVHEWTLINSRDGYMYLGAEEREQFQSMAKQGGIIRVSGKEGYSFSSSPRSTYTFKWDVEGYNNARKFLR